jgi:phosphatidate phosphatase APP1
MIKKLLGINKTPFLKVYRGYGSRESFVVMGHVSEDFVKRELAEKTSRLQNMLYFFRLYLSSPLRDQEVHVSFNSKTHTSQTNHDGFFHIEFTPHDLTLPQGSEWLELDVTLPETKQIVTASILIEGSGNTYGIISDVDDTVLISSARNKTKLLVNTVTKNYFTRESFEHVADWYQQLIRGSDGVSTNPIFYVSSSHWNLYEFLKEFLTRNKLPNGPLLLKRFSGFKHVIKTMSDHSHKQSKIEHLLETYSTLPFVLIGDSGQHDPTLYANIVEKHPHRIKAIYIRDVVPGKDPRIEEAQKRVGKAVPILSFDTTAEAIEDARKKGLTT